MAWRSSLSLMMIEARLLKSRDLKQAIAFAMRSSTNDVLRIAIFGLVAAQRFIPPVLPTAFTDWDTMQMLTRKEGQ